MSGQALQIQAEGLADTEGKLVLKFSKSYQTQLIDRIASGYKPMEARVNFIVFWKNQEQDQELKVVLPELVFERKRE